jgi:hypothetical protein
MACDCIRLRIAYKPSESSLWVEGILDLTSANQTGTFGNGQPYWQFPANQVWETGYSGPNIEISQVAGVGAWKIYAIDSVPTSPNTGIELLEQNLPPLSEYPCPEFIKYEDKVFDNYIFDGVGFRQTLVSADEWIARTECCSTTEGDFYVYINNLSGALYALLQDPTGDLNGTPYWQFEPLVIDTNLPSGVYVQLSRGTDGLGNWAFYIIPAIQDPSLATDIWYEYLANTTISEPQPAYPNELNGTSGFWQNYTVSGFNDVDFGITIALCEESPTCTIIQNRTQKEYDSIKLPQIFIEQDRGYKICCDCPMLVVGSAESETWKTDVTSAWIKLSDVADTSSFLLYKNDVLTSYTPPVFQFPNEPNAFYTTVNWYDVLVSDGIGCYELKVAYNISGVENEFTWGKYDLKPYSVANTLTTARIRVKYNLKHQIEGINFTGANVEDCIRFNGFIGERQPNTEIDNLIYKDRVLRSVVRENLDTYIITTDPLLECFIRPLTDLFLLSENEMYISDYNAHNHSYRILDTPVILQETPEIDYIDILQRRAKLTATVGIKTKNRRTYY